MTEIAPELEANVRGFAADWAEVFLTGVEPEDNHEFVRRLIFCSFAAGAVLTESGLGGEVNDLFVILFADHIDAWISALEAAVEEV